MSRPIEPAPLSRRSWLAAASAGVWAGPAIAARAAAAAVVEDDPGGLIVRSARPLDLETPVTQLDSWLTPNDRFFVRSHFGSPLESNGPWVVALGGLVERPIAIDPKVLTSLESVTVPAVLQCAGNGRAYFQPRIPGLAWDRGAVGHAEWTGVRLADLLERAGVRPEALHVHFLGADGPPAPKVPAYLRSIPLDRALDRSTILATGMNGAPLPALHGGPIRLVVPGWAGNHWMKWVRTITLAAEEAPGFYMRTGYKMPKVPTPPDVVPQPADLVPVTTLNVKSLITRPAESARLDSGTLEVGGVAWTGDGHVTRVEVWNDRHDRWHEATLLDPPRPGSWRRWRQTWTRLEPGPIVVKARATDSTGAVQPEATPWNKSGYLWNGIDRVACQVR